jgi:hypothetical protein
MIVANGFDDTVDTCALGEFQDPRYWIPLSYVERIIRPQLSRDPQAERLEISDDGAWPIQRPMPNAA